MKFLKYLFFLILILFVGVALYFGTQEGDFTVTESHVIQAPVEVVFEQVNDYKNWENWGTWVANESMKINYPETTSGEGATYSWNSKEVGEGAMQTLSVTPNNEIKQKIIFSGSLTDNGNLVTWTFHPEASGLATKIEWSIEGSLSLFEKIYLATQDFKIEDKLELIFEESLKNLDRVIQEEMSAYSITNHGLTNHSGRFYLYNTTASKQSELGAKTTPMIEQIEHFMSENNLPAQGSPFVIYNDWDELNKSTIFSVGIPTSDMVILPDGSPVISGHMPPLTAIKITLKGNYTNLSKAWDEAEKYIQESGYNKNDDLNPFEVYIKKFPEEKIPSKWVTDVYIPIENIGNEYEESL